MRRVEIGSLAVLALAALASCSPAGPTPPPAPPASTINCTASDGGTITNCGTGNGNITNPAPSPSPSGGAKVSDVRALGQFFYGWAQSGKSVCPPYNEANKHADGGADFTLPAGCEGAITCTPFTDKDDDGDGKKDNAKDPSRNVTWSSAGPVSLAAKGEELTFNRFVTSSGTGIATIKCDFVDSAGVFWTKTATYSVHGS